MGGEAGGSREEREREDEGQVSRLHFVAYV